jgi:hypothetical protein
MLGLPTYIKIHQGNRGTLLRLYSNNETDNQRNTQADTRQKAKRNYLQAATV